MIESSRDAKRLAIVGALSLNASRTDREIGRLLGIDPKTVKRVRAERGEIHSPGGEIPADSVDFPASEEAEEA